MTGFNDWIEIFQGGLQIDSTGKSHDGDALIARAVATFDAAYHEPPAVIGHPATDDPAYGLVSAVTAETRDGKKVLLAKFRDVEPAFASMVKDGRFPKRSAAFYADGRLRHVGFLGAVPPAVKGLKNMKFLESASATFEFSTPNGAENRPAKEARSMTFAEIMDLLKFWETSRAKAPQEPASGDGGKKPAAFSEADLEAAKKTAGEAARKQALAEFNENARKGEVAAFCEKLIADGKIPPSWKDAGLVEFAQALADGAEFAEGKGKSKLAWFKEFLTGFGKAPLFSELATKEKAGANQAADEAKQDAALARRISTAAGRKEDK